MLYNIYYILPNYSSIVLTVKVRRIYTHFTKPACSAYIIILKIIILIECETPELTEIECVEIIVDTVTGVNYIYRSGGAGFACGLTVLIDADGKPVVTKAGSLDYHERI